jgi:hypothetical protein
MRKLSNFKADQHFTSTGKKDHQALKEKDKAWQALMQKTSRLKALREAKEAADREAAAAAPAPASKKKPKAEPQAD